MNHHNSHHSISAVALLFVAALLTGCGQREQTRADFESNHPYAKLTHVYPAHAELGTLAVYEYRDLVPTMLFENPSRGTNAAPTVGYRDTTYLRTYDDAGNIIARGRE
jgi:hypothetical protein